MRRLTALALLQVLFLAAPAFADDMDSQQQTEGYGRLFAYVCAVVSGGLVLLGGVHIFKGFISEATRGKKAGVFQEHILDDPREKKNQKKKKVQALYLGEKVPDWKVLNRQGATRAALKVLSGSDEVFSRKNLMTVAVEAFRMVKAAVEDRSAKAIERRVGTECLEKLQAEIKGLRKKGELHVYGDIDVTDLQIVHIEAAAGKQHHTFTALISAVSRDYFKDDKTGRLVRGDKKMYEYQEFWRFFRVKDRWLVERIRPSADMDVVLNAKNILAQRDLDAFAKDADPDHLREFVGK